MPAPILTPEEVAQLEKEAAKQQSFADALSAAVPAKQARAQELEVADGAFKKFFDYYNDDIIAKYDAEKKAISGDFVANPITEADVEGPASIDGSVRTTPSLPATDIVRVDEFDGTPLAHTDVNEQQHIADQAEIEDVLVNGYGSGAPTTALTTTSITPASTTVSVTNTALETITAGSVYVVTDGVNLAVVEVDNVTDTTPMAPPPPPYTADLDITLIVPSSGTIGAGAQFLVFTGFTNGERTTKTASDSSLQPLMDSLIDQLEGRINDRIDRIDEELAALAANEDPDGTAEIAAATTAANTSKTFLTNYLVTTDISDTGLASLATERGVRSPFLVTRLSQIDAAYTGQTENYYDRRYQIANDRGNTSRGTLRLQKATEASAATLVSYAASAQDAVDAIDALLNP